MARPLLLRTLALLALVSLAGCRSGPDLAPELLRPFPKQAEVVGGWQAGIHPGSRVDDGLITHIRPDWRAISTPARNGFSEYREIVTRSGAVDMSGTFAAVLAGALGVTKKQVQRAELRGVTSRQVRSINDLDAVSGTYIWAVWYVAEASAALVARSGGELRVQLDPEQRLMKRVRELEIDFDIDQATLRVGKGAHLPLAVQLISLDARSRRADRRVDVLESPLLDLPFGYQATVLEFFPNHGDVVFELLNPLAGPRRTRTVVRLFSGRPVPLRYEPGQVAGVRGAVTDVFTYRPEKEGGRFTGRGEVVVHRTQREWQAARMGRMR